MKKLILLSIYLAAAFKVKLANAEFVIEDSVNSDGVSITNVGGINLFENFYSVITFFLALLFLSSIVGGIFAGFKFFIAGGSEKVIEDARKWGIYSLITFSISLFSYIILNIFKHLVY